MTMRRFLHRFLQPHSVPHPGAEEITGPHVTCRPGMHQPVEEPEPLLFTAEDREFLRQLGIRTRCDRARESICASGIVDEIADTHEQSIAANDSRCH